MDVSDSVTAGIAAVSALVALVALYFTRQQVRLAQRQTALQEKVREDQAQPYVWADIRQDDRQMHLMKFVLHNEGPTVATDVRVTFDPPLPRLLLDRQHQAVYTMIGMPPGRHVEWNLGASPDWIQNPDISKRFTVTVEAEGPYGPVEPLRYELDVDEYRQASASPPGNLYGVAKALTDLTTALKKR